MFLLAHERPFRLNAGTFVGGAWPSSEPATSTFVSGRLRSVADAVGRAAAPGRGGAGRRPGRRGPFEGFRAVAYCDRLDHDLAAELRAAHETVHGGAPDPEVLPGTTDARSVAGPAVCYGPVAGAIHATDEWVDIDSAEAVAATIALTAAAWQQGR